MYELRHTWPLFKLRGTLVGSPIKAWRGLRGKESVSGGARRRGRRGGESVRRGEAAAGGCGRTFHTTQQRGTTTRQKPISIPTSDVYDFTSMYY